MKQTNNAIKFLMAQYRAIFKNAYFKGMATALVLTAGLAAGANTSQAADNNWYTASGDVTDVTNWAPGKQSGSTNASSGAAGSIDFGTSGSLSDGTIGAGDGIASGGRLDIGSGATTVGSDFEVEKVTGGSAYGGYVNISAGSSTAGAVDNKVTLNNGGGINKSMFGAYVKSTVGSAYATDNAAIINLGAKESARIQHSDNNGGLFGASVQTSNGIATATNNRVEINLNSAISDLKLTNGSFGVVGAVAQGNEGIVATGNSVTVNVKDAQTSDRINLSSGGVNSIQGAFALNQTANAVAPTVTAANNSVKANNISFGTDNGAYIFGGRAMNNANANAGADLISRDNIVTLSNVDITSKADGSHTDVDMQIIGNFAQVLVNAAPDTGDNRATAIGNGSTVNLSIDGGTLSYTSAGNADPTVSNTGSVAAGGIAYTGSGGGSASANLNVASIKNIKATNVNFYGGAAFTTSADAKEQTEASNNTLTIDSVSLDVNSGSVISYTNNHVAGGLAFLSGIIDDASAEASSNTLNVTNSSYESSNASTAKTISSNLYGAVVQTSTSGATVTANQNAVSVGNGLNVNGSIYGAQSKYNGTFTGNTVSFDATLTGAANSTGVIAGVGIETGTSGSGVNNLATISLLNNTVTLGTNARVTNTSIVGAQLANNNATHNDVIHSGNNVIVNGVYIVDNSSKEYNLAGDDVQINDTAVIHVKEGTLNISGLSNGATAPAYFNGTGTVAAGAKIANNGTINVYNALDVQGDDSLIATADKALINVNAGSFADETNNHDPVTESKATLYISQQGLTNYLTGSDTRTTLYDQVDVGDKAGTLNVTSGGTVDFKTAVTLNDFSFSSANAESAAEAGKIHVSGGAANEVVANFRADTVNLEHALVTDTKTLSADLKNIGTLAFDNADAIAIQANTLNLGTSDLSSTRSESIKFGKATVRDEINFLAATSGNDIKNDGTQVGPNIHNDGFHLTSEVVGSHYMLTNTQDGKLQYYTAQSGVVNGPVTIQGTSGALTIQNGNWTAHDQITVADGGTLTVGGEDGIENDKISNRPDATLVLDQALVLDVSATNSYDGATVSVSGDSSSTFFVADYTDALDSTIAAPTDRVALLDLRNGLTLERDTDNLNTNGGISGAATISATNNGIVLLKADDVNTILAQNEAAHANSGAFFKASNGGAFIVEGDMFTDFDDFRATASGNGIDLTTDGILVTDTLTVENDNDDSAGSEHNDKAYIAKADSVSFGGSVYVGDLAINDLQLTNGGTDGKDKPADAGNYASKVVVANGDVHVSKSLTSYNQTLVLGTNDSSASFTFATDAKGDAGTISIDNLRVDSGSLTFHNGTWTANNITLNAENTSLTVGGDTHEDINGVETAAKLTANTLTMSGGSHAYIEADGTANFKSADFSKLDGASDATGAFVKVAGKLEITDSVKFGKEGSILIQKNGELVFGGTATNAAIVKDGNYTSTNATVLTSANSGTFTKIRNEGGELQLGLASTTVFGKDQIRQLKADLFTSDSFEGSTLEDRVLKNGGVLNIGDASFNGVNVNKLEGEGLSGYYASWDDLKSFSDIYGNDVTSNELKQTNVQGIEPGDNIQGNWGSLSMIDGLAPSAQVEIAGNTKLTFAEGNNGFFISDKEHKIALGAIIQGQNDLTLENGGTIGKITMEAGTDDAEKNLTILNVVGSNKTTIDSIVGEVGQSDDHAKATAVRIQGGETVVNNDITAIDEVEVHEGASLNVKGDADILNLSTFNANAKFDKTLTVRDGEILGGTTEALDVVFESAGNVIDGRDFDSLDVANGGTLKADTFTFKNDPTVVNNNNGSSGNGVLMVGYDLTEAESTLENGTKITGTGYLEISNYLDLNGGTLVVDPAYGEATSVAAVMNFKDAADSDKSYETVLNDVGIVNGSALIGKNAALGIGATLAETQEAIAKYQTNGSFSEEDYGSILYLNGQMTLAHGSEIALNSASTVRGVENIRDTLKYNLVAGDSENLREDQLADLGLGANTAILMTEKAFISDDKGNKNGVAITFDRTNAVVNGQGGDIVLIGSFDAKDPLNFFKDNDAEGQQGVKIIGGIDVYTQNGFLYTRLEGDNAGYGEQLKVDTDRAYAVMNEASNPVVETLISYHVDRGGAVAGDTTTDSNDSGSSSLGGAEKEPLTPLQDQQSTANAKNTRSGPNVTVGNGETNTPPTEDNDGTNPPANDNNNGNNNQQTATTRVTGSSDFLNEVVTTSHGAPAEAAARLAIYGGAVQAAMAATSSTTDAIAARMGVGNTANITMANNGQGAALWLAPVYKTHDSDSFDSQGLDYGVDLNLYGVALGADFEFMPGLTAGIMFNVGSGDADGQGNAAANNTSNDFDYWGAAIYGNYTYDALSVTADVSYTAVDNDLEASTGMSQYSKLESSTDTTAISLGVTAKYTFDFGGVEVAPHAGLRYTNIDLDDYSIKSNGETIADYSADKVNIFSIPVGVTFAKEFTGEAWTVKPSLDLTLTGNFGDDDISGDVSWTGVNNLVTPVSSEYMDDFTYGATLGIEAASTSGFSLGLGVNYTGSSNVDEFGVNANARFVF